MVWKYAFGKEKYIKQINAILEWQKKIGEILPLSWKMLHLKRIRGYDTGEEGGGSRCSFAK